MQHLTSTLRTFPMDELADGLEQAGKISDEISKLRQWMDRRLSKMEGELTRKMEQVETIVEDFTPQLVALASVTVGPAAEGSRKQILLREQRKVQAVRAKQNFQMESEDTTTEESEDTTTEAREARAAARRLPQPH